MDTQPNGPQESSTAPEPETTETNSTPPASSQPSESPAAAPAPVLSSTPAEAPAPAETPAESPTPASTPAPTPSPAPDPAPAATTPPTAPASTPPPAPETASAEPAPVEPVLSPTPEEPKKPGKFSALKLLVIVVVVAVLIGGGLYVLIGRKDKKAAPVANVKIGLMMAFSGGSSAMGYGTSKGVALAKKQLNANNITVVNADSKCDPQAALKAINQLIKDHVKAIIGDGCSSASLAVLPLANNAQIPLISPSASSTKLSIQNDYFFRVIPNDNQQGAFMAETVYKRGIRSAAIFYTNEPYGASIQQAFQDKFESLGGKVVATAFSQPNVIDLSSQIATLKAAHPQAIFFAPNSVTSGIAAVKLAHQDGIKVPYFGADVYYDQSIITNAADAVEGMTFTTFPTGNPTFKQSVANAYPSDGQLYAAPEAYDAFKAIYLATQRGASTGQQIKNMLPSIKFQGVSAANVSFNQYGDLNTTGTNYSYALFNVKNGKFVQQN